MAQIPILMTKLQHVDISQHWLQERVQSGDIHIQWIEMSNMTADRLTKVLTWQKQERFMKQLVLVNIKERLDM